MSYNFNQFRRGQLQSYLLPLNYSIDKIEINSILSSDITFVDKVVVLSAENILQSVDNNQIKRGYYLKFKIHKDLNTIQNINIKLVNTEQNSDNIQNISIIKVEKGQNSDYSSFEIVISPNANYNQIVFELNRVADDYSIKNEDGTYGRIINIEIEELKEIYNVINFLNPSIDNKGKLKQIGVQSAPGLLMCIDGEGIKVGRTGIYEINNGINISFLGFVVNENDNKNFILDYQY